MPVLPPKLIKRIHEMGSKHEMLRTNYCLPKPATILLISELSLMAYHANRQYSACLGGIFIFIFLLCMGAQAQSTPPASQPSSSAKQTTAQQQPQSAYESATVLKTITRMVVVDIVATDRRDHLVPDLTAADF